MEKSTQPKITLEEQLEQYKRELKEDGNHDLKDAQLDELYKLYVACSKIIEGSFDKKIIFGSCLYNMLNVKDKSFLEVFEEIEKVQYRKIGDYYQFLYNGEFYTEEGDIIRGKDKIDIRMEEEQQVSAEKLDKLSIDEERKKYLCSQLNQNIEQEKTSDSEQETFVTKIAILDGKLIEITWNKCGNKEHTYFVINDDGTIKKAPIRIGKKTVR